jgi:hypothetical protein
MVCADAWVVVCIAVLLSRVATPYDSVYSFRKREDV